MPFSCLILSPLCPPDFESLKLGRQYTKKCLHIVTISSVQEFQQIPSHNTVSTAFGLLGDADSHLFLTDKLMQTQGG